MEKNDIAAEWRSRVDSMQGQMEEEDKREQGAAHKKLTRSNF